MKSISAVLWDMDGTLIDSEHIAAQSLRSAMQEIGLSNAPNLHERFAGKSADVIYEILVAEFGLRLDQNSWEQRKHHYHFAAADNIKALPESISLFRQFDRAGVKQAIVSNSDRAIMDMQLRIVDLTWPGMITISRNDVRVGKPNPEGYLRAAWLLNATPNECLVVEDSAIGVEAGLSAGMRTLLVSNTNEVAPHGAIKLKSMTDLAVMVIGQNT